MIVTAWVMIAVMASGGMTMGSQQTVSSPWPRWPPPMPAGAQIPSLPQSAMLICLLAKHRPGTQRAAGDSGRSSSLLSLGGSGLWALMIIAMMLPSALPAATYAATQSLRWRRRRAMMEFVVGYGAVWLPAGTLILAATAGLQGSAVALLAAMCLAALWQLMPLKRRALLDCHRPASLAPYGGAALRAAVSFGIRNGWACVRSCWPLMAVMSLVPELQIESMGAITVLVLGEKLARRPSQAVRHVSAVLGTAAALTAVLIVA